MKCCFVISSHDFLDRLNRALLLTDILLSQGFPGYKAVDKSRVRTESDYEYDERDIGGHLLRRYYVKVMQAMLAPVKLSKQ
jgi:hypothetical protein